MTSLSKEVVVCHKANHLPPRSIITGKEFDFKKSFIKYKDYCSLFLKENKKFVYTFGSEEWYDEFVEFQARQHELIMQELYFKFSDGSEWTVFLNDLANLRLMLDSSSKNKNALLSNPVDLADWAQSNLSWSQIKDFCVLRNITGNEDSYSNEWSATPKKVLQYQYKSDPSIN
jgi:hypothetical protein